jgi:hypothetical protein
MIQRLVGLPIGIPMAFDVTVVFTSVVTGMAGYSGARLQGRVALAQSRAQTEQATADRDLPALEKRQVAYHDRIPYGSRRTSLTTALV